MKGSKTNEERTRQEQEQDTDRVPPSNIEAERRVLGAMLFDTESIVKVLALPVEAFYNTKNQRVFRAILKEHAEGKPFDDLSLAQKLKKEDVSTSYIGDLVAEVSTSAHIEHHAEMLTGLYIQRRLLVLCDQTSTQIYKGEVEPNKAIADLSQNLEGLSALGISSEAGPINGADLLGMDFPPVTWLVDNMIPEIGLTMVAGRHKIGKSALTLQLARCLSRSEAFLTRYVRDNPQKVLYYALEDGRRRIAQRMKGQNWTEEDASNVTFDDRLPVSPYMDAQNLIAIAKQTEKVEANAIVLDCVRKFLPPGVDENDNSKVAKVLDPIQTYAQRSEKAVIIVHHMGKGKGMGEDSFGMEDVRGASAFGDIVDMGIMLYRARSMEAKIRLSGRDLVEGRGEETEFALGFSGKEWSYLGGAELIGKSEKKRKAIETLKELGEGTAEEVAKEAGVSKGTAWSALKEMEKDGSVSSYAKRTKGRDTTVYVWEGVSATDEAFFSSER